MRKLLGFFFLFFCFSFAAHAQQTTGTLTGTIVDTISHNVNKASVSLMNAADTTKVWHTLSDNDGKFSFSGLDLTTYVLRISFQGYEVLNRYVALTKEKPNVDLGEITLQQTMNELGTVVVTAVIPMTMKGDTTEYSADAFGTKPNATVEDLLKKLPNVQVDKNGGITAQGESVTRVFVDGKRFFGNDPKLATQNLPKDVVDKIQVFDGKSDQAEFSGFDDGNTIKTINIVTKRNMRHGWFGKSTAGIGNDEATLKDPLYAVSPRILYFNGDMKAGLFGNLNNINQQNFTRDDQTSKNGLTKTRMANLFFGNTFGKTDFNGNYQYANTGVNLNSNSITQYFYNDSSFNTNNYANDTTDRTTQRHSVNLNFDTKFDSANELRVRPNVSFTSSHSTDNSLTRIDSLFQGNEILKSNTNANRVNNNDGRNTGISATYRHAFAKKGRTISVDLQYSNTHSNSSSLYVSDYYDAVLGKDSLTNQRASTINNGNSLNTTLTYTEPIAQHQQLQIEYSNSFSKNVSDRETFNFDSTKMDYSAINDELTNKFDNKYTSNRGTLGYLFNNGVINFNAGIGVQFGKTESNNLTHSDKSVPEYTYTNLYPTANFTYNISKEKKFIFKYQGRTSQPSIQQLQPIKDSSNILAITSGNPNLKQEFNNHFQFRYNNIDRVGGKSFFAFIDASIVQHNITSDIERLDNGGQSTTYINMNGNYNVRAFVDWSFPIISPKSNIDFSTNISNARSVTMLDNAKSYTYNTSLSEGIKWSTNMEKSWDINFSTTPTYNIAKYSVNKQSNSNYYSQSTSVDGTWYSESGWQLATDFDYTFYTGNALGQNVSIPLWNASISKSVFANQAGQITLSVNDILNQNKGVEFTRSSDYSRQTRTNILKRYVMLTFTYNLKSFPGMGKRGNRNHGDRPWMRGGDGPPPGGGGFGGGRGRGGF
ncbi:hypothetical protein A9P82_04940 [Arachidicoccus ginsenosidimutans]|uniref:TonB-dependent receptor n=1 Tax=Arachidicoccus sp. BS20 TaxID=1850526 RepID=UPI0007F11942|nr:TonB-dependent receptor [Arachidicoccus sp. BS20]ANI88688.1 hypothetical protein A9P82_04940 [Arachidicoccus sp. BS20]